MVTDKIKELNGENEEVSDDGVIEGDDRLQRHVKLLSRKLKTCKRMMQSFRIDFSEWQSTVLENRRYCR